MRALMLAVVTLLGCARSADADKPERLKPTDPLGPSNEVVLARPIQELDAAGISGFIDHAERYRGKVVTIRCRVDTSIFAADGDSLQKHAGRDVAFYGFGEGDQQLEFRVRMPKDNLPAAVFADEVVVTFLCSQGELQFGNEGRRVDRP